MRCAPARNLLILGSGVPASPSRSACSPPRFGFGGFPSMTICDKILLRLGIQRIIHDLVSIPSGSLPAQPRVLMFGSGVRLHWPVPHFLLLILGSGCTGCTRYVNNFGISSGCTGPFLLIFGSGGSARNGYVDLFGFSSSFWVRHKTREKTTVRPAIHHATP